MSCATFCPVSSCRTPRERGTTFLEVVLATALLALVAAALTATVQYALAAQSRQRRELAAMEVAHRLVLNYLDSPTEMPDPARPVEYGTGDDRLLFRWEYREDPVRVVEQAENVRDRSRMTLGLDRYRAVTVRVWLSEQSGGSRFPDAMTPQATLVRLLDPIYPRNPDSFNNILAAPGGLERLVGSFMGFPPEGGAAGRFERPRARSGGTLAPREAFRVQRRGSPRGVPPRSGGER